VFALQRGEDSWHDAVRLHDDHINTTAPWVLGTEDKAIPKKAAIAERSNFLQRSKHGWLPRSQIKH